MNPAVYIHICRDQKMSEILCTDENLVKIIMRNDKKMKFQEVGTFFVKLHDDTIKKAFEMR